MGSGDIDADIRAFRERSACADSEAEYARLLKTRSVAIVGPARTLLGTGHGSRIDAHDLVVRFNDALEFLTPARDLADDLGTRVDILYANQVVLRGLLARRRLPLDAFERAGLQYIVCTNNSLSYTAAGLPSDTCQPQDRRTITDLSKALERGGSTARVRVVHDASAILSRWLEGNWARTGLIGILDVLHFDVRKLFVTGMTFYHGGGHLLMPDAAELHPLKNRDGTWAQAADGLGHDSYLELEVMKRLARRVWDVLEVDDVLAGLLRPDLRSA